MEQQRQTQKTLLLLVLLLAVLVGAYVGYRALSGRVKPASPATSGDAVPAEGIGTGSAADTVPGEEETGAADFTVYDRAGNAVSLSSFRGKPVVVNFWATWCPPCRMELPYFDAAYAKYGEDVAFLMVDLTDGQRDTVESAAAFTDEAGYSYPLYFDTDFSGAAAYAVNAIPLTVFVDADGNLVSTHLGAMDEETLRAGIEGMLPGNE
ncbi:MAG: TlpA family protein disulfide reductase [Clostridiales bacterium]|nr:TlpA family protein disulfide reductase [Clostridiales bacterium]